MTTDDLVSLAAYALGAWSLGYGMGLFMLAFRKFTDKI
jgi:hypothetical protein